MKISIITVGKIKEKYFVNAIKEYTKRLSRYCDIREIEVSDEKCPENLSPADMVIVKNKEGDRILSKVSDQMYVIALAIDGKQLTSEGLSEMIDELGIRGKSNIAFVIGGSLGLADSVLKRADYKLSFSKMTFPHLVARVMLIEQIYRAITLEKNIDYHK